MSFISSSFRVLNYDSVDDRFLWEKSWLSWPEREVQAHPCYGKLFCSQEDFLLCATWEDENGGIIFPIIVRPLKRENWAKGYENYFDAVNPYGYGGPFVWGDALNNKDEFWCCFNEWAKKFGLISLFTRLSLFDEQLLPFEGEVEIDRPNVVRSLLLSEEEIWYDYEHKVRKNVKKALAAGLVAEKDFKGTELKSFLEIYQTTMDRCGAASGYYFSEDFFRKIITSLPGQFVFFHVRKDDQIVSTEMVLVSEQNIYSFLGGTLKDAFNNRPNDLLKHEIIKWGMQNEKKNFVLGGGYGEYDGIFKYKLSFAPKGELPFKVAKNILLPDQYASLVKARTAYENEKGIEWKPKDKFFPAYRS
jgi:hypothetical protein